MSVPDILPPSPPSTSHRDRMITAQPTKPITSTPDDSPASFLPSSGTGTRKRVGFISWSEAKDAPSSDPLSESSILRALPRSKDCHSMVRSILKPYSESDILAFGLDGTNNARSAVTMDSIVEQLANNDKISSVDAYQSLAQLIKTYDEIPEDSDTKTNVSTILRYVKRDLTTQDQNLSTPVDMNLATQALKVSVIFAWSEHLSPLLTDDFRIFITDRAINALVEHTAPKVVIVHYMHLLATQNFRSMMFTAGTRTGKLLEALRDITNHVQGKGAISERLLVYQKLIEQAKPIMKAKAGLWVREVLMGLTSKVKDIQEKAMSVCSRTCASFPMSSQISQATREALVTAIKDRNLNAMITQRLINMITAKDEAVQVPQIWALVMLMCNSAESRLENWSYMKEWLKVLQRCFNCSDVNVRIQAFPAWNRFIYITRPHEASDSMLSMLAKPIVAQIEKTSTHTSGKGTRPAAVSSYCTLLYYAFRPAANSKQYTRSWNEYIVKVATSQFLSKSTANADLCCRMLMALFWKDSSASRIWNENRAHENKPADPEELPTIDCKWIRSKTGPILDIFRLLFKYSAWGPSVLQSDQAFVAKAWRHLMKAIRESASKEIKQSNDSKKAMMSIVGFLNEIFEPEQSDDDSGIMDDDQGREYSARTQVACNIAIVELGAQSITDAMSSITDQRNPVVLGELLRHSTNLLHADRVLVPSSPISQTLLNILDEEFQQCYSRSRTNIEKLTTMLEISTKTLSIVTAEASMGCLQSLEKSFSIVIGDKEGICKTYSSNLPLQKAWLSFSSVLMEKLGAISTENYSRLDELFTAVLLSSNEFTPNQMLNIWDTKVWKDEGMICGEKMQDAIAAIQKHAEVNLPGVKSCAMDDRPYGNLVTAINDNLVSNLSATVGETLEDPKLLSHFDDKAVLHPQIEGVASPTRGVSPAEPLLPRNEEHLFARKRLRHDDSQVQFVSIALPLHPEEIESQLMTERQKEVRDQQRNEPAITFADLRSSPRSRTKRSSRAPSMDCEMARKVAAMDAAPAAPATPTLSRQADNVDDEVLPSPTPKSRQHRLRIAEIDIPSSPPSVLGNQDVQLQEIMPSPSKVAHVEDDTIVDLGSTHPEFEVVAYKSSLENVKASDQQIYHGDHEVERGVASISDCETGIQDAAIAQNMMHKICHSGQPEVKINAKVIFNNDPADSDEVDEASASQLSQDLDWHLRREVSAHATSTHDHIGQRAMPKKRKHANNSYADNDRKRRRRKSSVRENLSSHSSDISEAPSEVEDNNAAANRTDVENYTIMRTTPKQSSLTQVTTASTPQASKEREGASIPTSGRRKRSKSKKSRHSPDFFTSKVLQNSLTDANQMEEDMGETADTNMEFHTPTPVRERDDPEVKMVAQPEITAAITIIPASEDRSPVPQQTITADIMTALQTALNSLKNNKHTDIDLRAIDDLCFQIRYQAQENAQKRV